MSFFKRKKKKSGSGKDASGGSKGSKGSKSKATKKALLKDETGLHVRPASLLAKKAMSFESSIQVEMGGQSANAKSIMELLTLAAVGGSELTLSAEGPDAQEAVESLAAFIDGGFQNGEG